MSSVVAAANFGSGDTVRVTANLNVRTGPGISFPEITDPDYPGYAPTGTIGEVLDGPSSADGYTWWEVDYGPGLYSGWSVEDWLEKVGLAGRKICIDPGHGGSVPGADGFGLVEKDVNLDVALRLEDLLMADGAIPITTRSSDTDVTLEERVSIANSSGCDSFVSIHANADANPSVDGTETFWSNCNPYPSESLDLAGEVNPRLVSYLGTFDRGVKQDQPYLGYCLYVLANTNMPAILTELAYITNPDDNAKLKDSYYRQQAARAILHGLQVHYGEAPHDPPAATLSVALSASPSSGPGPLSTDLTADVSGTAPGTSNYTFWWNCNDPGTSVDQVMAICGSIPTPGLGTCTQNEIGVKCNAVTDESKTVSHSYSSAGSYTAKVIAERGSAPPAEARVSITVSTPTPTPTPCPEGKVPADGGCGSPTPIPTHTPTPTATPTKQPAGDTDGDGCSDTQENGPNEALGGQRDPHSFWDFMDVYVGDPPVRDKIVSVGDIGGVVARFATSRESPPTKEEALVEALTPPTDLTSYHPAFDRNGSDPEGNVWDLFPPDGIISVGDIGAVVGQFTHTCA